MKKQYKITIRGDGNNHQYDVWEQGDITHVMWKNYKGVPFSLSYMTREVIQYLKEGRWVKVPSKREQSKIDHSLSPNLFSLDDL